jgi:sugar lactone lactonase YvrE
MCGFGGKNLDTLYVTTATYPLTETALAKQPLAGSLFAIDVGVCGQPEPFFAG